MSRYRQLDNKQWLQTQILQGKSAKQLANELGCCLASIYAACRYHKLIFPSPTIQLQNRQWLFTQYITNKKSTREIALMLGCSKTVVQDAIYRFGIETRTPKVSRLLRREEDFLYIDDSNIAIINGSLLGDASMTKDHKYAAALPIFQKGNINKDHILHVATRIFSKDPEKRIWHINKSAKRKQGINHQDVYMIASLTHDFLAPLYDKWYPLRQDGTRKKIVPKNITIDALTLLHWFMDDGYSEYTGEEGRVGIGLCTQGFTIEDNNFLIEQLAKLGIGARIQMTHKGRLPCIRIFQQSSAHFYEVIGPCPEDIPSMQYKWKFAEQYVPKFYMLHDKDWMIEQHVEQKKRVTQIANELGCSRDFAGQCLSKHGVRRDDARYKFSQMKDKDFLHQMHVIEGKSLKQISEEVGCSERDVRSHCNKHGIPINRLRSHGNYPQLRDKEWMHEQHINLGKTTRQISEEIGSSERAVRGALERYGVPIREVGHVKYPKLQDKEWLKTEYEDKGRKCKDIAIELGCHESQVAEMLKRHGISIRPKIKNPQLADKNWLFEQYVSLNKTAKQIAQEIGANKWSVISAVERLGIRKN